MATRGVEADFLRKRCEGGTGNSGRRIIPDATSRPIPDRTVSYLGIDIVALYVNKESGWLNDRIVIGSIEVEIADKKVQRLLGPFTVQKDTKFAPTFEISLLQDQPYRGNDIKVKVMLRADKRDTPIKPVLDALVTWGARIGSSYLPLVLPVINIPMQAASPDSANDALLESMKQFIFNNSKTQEPIFDQQSGIEFKVEEEQLLHEELFLLIHRGQSLDSLNITVKKSVNGSATAINPTLYVTCEDGSEFKFGDGAFVLLRIKREMVLDGALPWDAAVDALHSEINTLIERVRNGGSTRLAALLNLGPNAQGTPNLYSVYMLLHEMISKAPMLIQADRTSRAEKLAEEFEAKKTVISRMGIDEPTFPPVTTPLTQTIDPQQLFRRILQTGPSPLRIEEGNAKPPQLPAGMDDE